jgi:hypothetical protein
MEYYNGKLITEKSIINSMRRDVYRLYFSDHTIEEVELGDFARGVKRVSPDGEKTREAGCGLKNDRAMGGQLEVVK